MKASYPSILVFSWVDKIIRVGWRKPLTDDDLYDLDPSDTCAVVNPKFVRNWDAQATRRAKNNPEIRPQLSVLLPLVTTYYGIFLKGSFFALISALLQQVPKVGFYVDSCNFQLATNSYMQVSPNILSLLIEFISNGEEMWKGYLYAILLVGANLLRTLFNSQYFITMQIMGLRLKSALSCFVFKKSMKLSPGARKLRTGIVCAKTPAVGMIKYENRSNFSRRDGQHHVDRHTAIRRPRAQPQHHLVEPAHHNAVHGFSVEPPRSLLPGRAGSHDPHHPTDLGHLDLHEKVFLREHAH